MRNLLAKMSSRERNLVFGALIFVTLSVLYALVFSPLAERGNTWQRKTANVRREYAEFLKLRTEYVEMDSALSGLQANLTSSGSDSSLLARMEATARSLGLQERITSMKPFSTDLDSGIRESSVEIRMEKLDLKGLVDLLEKVESAENNTRVGRLRVKTRFDDPSLVDITILVSVLETR
jgi:general secretion pathway protein M